MKNLRRVYQLPDGSLAIVNPAWDDGVLGFGRTAHQTEAEWYEWAITYGIDPAWVSMGDVDAASLPVREFRDQWRHDGKKVYIDPELETAERWVRVRRERNQLLTESDGLMARANETGVKANEWKAYRQALRDVPAQADPRSIEWPVKPKHNIP